MPGPADDQLTDLIRRFSRLVRTAAARVGGAGWRELADDVEQRVFLNVWKQLEGEKSIDHPASYIYRCAIRETVRLMQDRREDTLEPDMVAALMESASPVTPDAQLASRERARHIADALKSLAIDRRRAAQAYIAGFSVADTMRMYGWSYDRARNLSARGMADLRAALRKRGIDG